MNPTKVIMTAILGGLLGGGVGFAYRMTEEAMPTDQQARTTPVELKAMPDFQYPDLNGLQRHSSEWKSKVMVLNFWAAWCHPCREEIPGFVALQDAYDDNNIQFIGIAIDDRQPVQDFVDTYGVNYPVLLGDMEAVQLSRQLGNRFQGLPFTVVAAPGGRLVARHAGELKRTELEPILQKLVSQS